jgi:beta-xylosidase
MYKILITLLYCLSFNAQAQVWVPDNGNDTNKNLIIYADYFDPDVIRVKNDYYMVASSFNCQPGRTVLHSKALVNLNILIMCMTVCHYSGIKKFSPSKLHRHRL